MSSKAAKRRAGYEKREQKRQQVIKRQRAISSATDIESLAKAMGVPLK